MIAHRLPTIQSAHRVVVRDAGRVVRQDRHAQLAAVDGPYRSLLADQLEAVADEHDR